MLAQRCYRVQSPQAKIYECLCIFSHIYHQSSDMNEYFSKLLKLGVRTHIYFSKPLRLL